MNRSKQSALIRVIIADDHALLRKGVRAALDPEPAVTIVGEVKSFRELISLLEHVSADVVLLDLGRMGASPVTAVSSLVRAYPQLAIIILSSHLGGAEELLRLGVRGYVAKEDVEEDVITAIHSVMNGKPFLSPAVINYMELAGGVRKGSGLTLREWDVLRLIAEGLGTDEIATQLGLAYQTVGNYVSSLYDKTGCTERTQLVEWYRRMSGLDE
jgi:DNA-binding NarL/FixJ family response regulator